MGFITGKTFPLADRWSCNQEGGGGGGLVAGGACNQDSAVVASSLFKLFSSKGKVANYIPYFCPVPCNLFLRSTWE